MSSDRKIEWVARKRQINRDKISLHSYPTLLHPLKSAFDKFEQSTECSVRCSTSSKSSSIGSINKIDDARVSLPRHRKPIDTFKDPLGRFLCVLCFHARLKIFKNVL